MKTEIWYYLEEIVSGSFIALERGTTSEIAGPEGVLIISIWEKVILLMGIWIVGFVYGKRVARRSRIEYIYFTALWLLDAHIN